MKSRRFDTLLALLASWRLIRNPQSLFPVRLHKLHADRLSVDVSGAGLSRAVIGHDHRLGRIDRAADHRGADVRRISDENELTGLRRPELEGPRLGFDRQRDARVVTIDPRQKAANLIALKTLAGQWRRRLGGARLALGFRLRQPPFDLRDVLEHRIRPLADVRFRGAAGQRQRGPARGGVIFPPQLNLRQQVDDVFAMWRERDRAVYKLDRLVEVLAPNQVDEREQFVGIREVGIELAREPERRAHFFDGLFGKLGYILALVELLAVDGESVVVVRQVILRTGFDRPPVVAPRLGVAVLPQPERSERLMRQRQPRIERERAVEKGLAVNGTAPTP